jgi:type III pantothenate kinase
MLMTFDIGNTHTVIGLYDGEDLKSHWRMSSTIPRTEDEFWFTTKGFLSSEGFSDTQIDGAAIASVVPHLTDTVSSMVKRYLNLEPLIVSAKSCSFLDIRYSTPETVGADRLCNAVAGYAKYGGPLIVVDFGTATTFDVIGAQGEYLGGAITLGVERMVTVLHHAAAKLTKVSLDFPESVIGNATDSSIQSGILFGTVEMVDGMIRRIWKELGKQTKVIATGGLASVIQPKTELVQIVEPFLVLDGLRLIFRRVHKS